MFIKGKKGKGHVEEIISFVIFIGFVLFLFTIFNPFSPPENTGLVDSIFLNIEDSLAIELRSISINIGSEVSGGDDLSSLFSSPLGRRTQMGCIELLRAILDQMNSRTRTRKCSPN